MTLEQRLAALITRLGAELKSIRASIPAPGGGSDPYTRKKLAADYTNATVTFANVTDGTTVLSFTPPANADWEIDADLLIQTTTATNLPRIGVSIAAQGTGAYGSVVIDQAGAVVAGPRVSVSNSFGVGAQVVQVPIGGLPGPNLAFDCVVRVKGRSGAAPALISIQMAAETAGANICFVKRGSSIKMITLP